jgi:hypothetical protein
MLPRGGNMLIAPITLAIFLLATQQPVAPSADGATTSAPHDPEPGAVLRSHGADYSDRGLQASYRMTF